MVLFIKTVASRVALRTLSDSFKVPIILPYTSTHKNRRVLSVFCTQSSLMILFFAKNSTQALHNSGKAGPRSPISTLVQKSDSMVLSTRIVDIYGAGALLAIFVRFRHNL